jgi:Mrp family chromosome partitioning ATPase
MPLRSRAAISSCRTRRAAAAEAFRTLVTALSLLDRRKPSNLSLERRSLRGQNFNAIHCATAFAQSGLKTILVDGDLRRPSCIPGFLTASRSPWASVIF